MSERANVPEPDTNTIRRWSVEIGADPRSVLREWRSSGSVKGISGQRIREFFAANDIHGNAEPSPASPTQRRRRGATSKQDRQNPQRGKRAASLIDTSVPSESTPLWQLTVGQFRELMRECQPEPPKPQTMLTQSDLCRVFQVSRAVVAEWVRDGIPTLRCGAQSPRYELTAVLEWLRLRSDRTAG